MAFNELEAIKLIDDGKISDKDIKFLSQLRDGVALEEVRNSDNKDLDEKTFDDLEHRGLVERVPLSHPRARVNVEAVIPTESGTTVLNLFDKRFRENANADRDANTAPNVDPELVKAPTAEEARKVPSIETKPLDEDKKNLGYVPEADKEAMKDPLVAAGARDAALAKTETERELEDAKVVIKDKPGGLNATENKKK